MREMLNRLARSEEICYKEMKKTVFFFLNMSVG